MATHGNLQEFKPDSESILAYLERVEIYFAANKVEDERKSSVLLNVIGAKIYGVLRSLLAPERPQDKSYDALAQALTGHFEPKPLLIAERFYFYRCDQAPGESITDYIAEL